jgi:hypothetical protein
MKYVPPANVKSDEDKKQTGFIGDGTPVVQHDELCPCASHPHFGDNDHLRSACSHCRCGLIRKVRVDERTRVVDGRPL